MIREARAEDASAIVDVQHKTWLTTYVDSKHGISVGDIHKRFSNHKQRTRHIKAQFADKSYKKWVSEIGGKVVGYCGAEKLPGMNHLGGFYILDQYQNQGEGSLLIHEALEWLGDKTAIKLTVATYNSKAIGFYEKFGFRIMGRVRHEQPTFASMADIPEYEMIREAK